jgi:hypothetical protein
MESLADLQSQLASLKATRIKILSGGMRTELLVANGAQGANRVIFQRSNLADLSEAILMVEAKIARVYGVGVARQAF